ncbi:hypothetical protein [Nocardia sp. XZ_19_369]|uniref:hypothetical protein n=1 Tax=Nocardia sp. XZ_19_369 TaxID=2769487 RepID=UPI001890AF74|nr:hypothetical protein [Nocardia sp. XZ_19_369]
MTNLLVTPVDTATPTTLYCRYSTEQAPQPCHVSLDLESGNLTADYNSEPGSALPESVYHQRTLWWSIPCLTADGANELLDALAPLAARVLAGASVEWNGNNNVGRFDADADAAQAEIAAACSGIGDADYPRVLEWDADDWFAEGEPPVVGAELTDAELGLLGESLAAEALEMSTSPRPDDVNVIARLNEWLGQARDAARSHVERDLVETAEAIDELETRRDELVTRVSGWLSYRAVGELARLSHTHARRIATAEPSDL